MSNEISVKKYSRPTSLFGKHMDNLDSFLCQQQDIFLEKAYDFRKVTSEQIFIA